MEYLQDCWECYKDAICSTNFTQNKQVHLEKLIRSLAWQFRCYYGDWLKECYSHLHVVASNLLMSLYYKQLDWITQTVKDAEQFLQTKKPKNEQATIQALLALYHQDAAEFSHSLQLVCQLYPRVNNVLPVELKQWCLPAHGLYALAQKLLPESIFEKIDLPLHKTFYQGFAKWRRKNPQPVLKLYCPHPKEMELLNHIYTTSPVKSCLKKSGKQMVLDHDKMREQFAKQILQEI